MLRYQAAAIALKLFGFSAATRSVYRRLGNRVRANDKTDLSGPYTQRGAWLVSRLRNLGLLDGRPLSALEVGTGWMHFYGVILSIAGVGEIDLYDQWDNRQFGRLRNSFSDFERSFDDLGLTKAEVEKAKSKIIAIRDAANFEGIYRALGMNYVVDPAGALKLLNDKHYDIVCSLDVLEHVRADKADTFLRAIFSVLKPGGVSLHQIGLDDHLTHYDRFASSKQYLAYDDRTWNFRYANSVQYVNRLSYDEFRAAFQRAGFEEIEAVAQKDPEALHRITVAPRFSVQSQESLHAVRAFMVHRKPKSAP